MDTKLQDFERLWTNRFPGHRLPNLSFLNDNPLNLKTFVDALKSQGEPEETRKHTLTKQLKEVQYCLSYILGTYSSVEGVKREKENQDSSYSIQSLYDRFDTPVELPHTPKRPSCLPLISDREEEKVTYINYSGSSGTSPYDVLPSPRRKVVHSEKFIDTMTKVCELIPPLHGRSLLESIGVIYDGATDLSRMLLGNEKIDESDLSPFFKALEDNQLAHLIHFFDSFKKREKTDEEENAQSSGHYMDMKPIKPPEQKPPALPNSPRPDISGRIFFPEQPTTEESPYYLWQTFSNDGQSKGPHTYQRRGSLDPTKLGSNRTEPRRGRHEPTKSLESKPTQLLSRNRPKPHVVSRSSSGAGFLTKSRRLFSDREAVSDSDEGGSRSNSPVRSPMSALGPRNGLQFVIRITEDCKLSERIDGGLTELEGYECLPLVKGERLDVICLWTDEYVARNRKTEIGLVPKDKCEILTGISPVLWEKEWFLKSRTRHSGSDLLQNESVGTFFIRESSSKPEDFVLSVKLATLSAKFQINVKMSRYEITPHLFASLDSLVEHYKNNPIYIDNGKEVFLTKPLKHGGCR